MFRDYVANESIGGGDVYFDDLRLEHVQGHVRESTDYYPFGGVLRRSRQEGHVPYRYGYQGDYAEQDPGTGWNSFELREYDSRIGRFTTVDPYGQFWSPYMAMGNDPVNNVDRDGGFAGPGPGFLGKLFGYNIATAANGVLGRVPGLLSGIGKFALPVLNTSISSSHMEVGGQLEDECPNCVLATYLRESMFLTYGSSSILNPFYKAEAIFGDLGGVLAGAESDVGKFFIISGPDKGKFIDYTEIAGGIAPEMGFGIELGRVDFTGDISAFSSSYLEGFRHKAWVGLSGEIIGVGAGFASSFIDGKGYVIGTSVQVGTGISTPITVGYNHGTVKLKKEEQ